MKHRILYILLGILVLILWEYYGTHSQIARLLLSSPSLVWKYFMENWSPLLQATATTTLEATTGLVIAILFSFSMMVVCFHFPSLMRFILPVMVVSQIIPLIVLAPFFIILMGIGLGSKIAMAALMCFFPIFVNFAQGYQAIPPNVHELLYIYHARTWTRIWRVYFPLSTPSIIAGLKISATLAVIGAIVAEFNGAENGLGKNLFLSAKRIEPELMMSSLVLAITLGLLLYFIIYLTEKSYGKWYKRQI